MEADKENRGVIFKNKNKQADTHADYSGVVNVEGKQFWINLWVNESKAGMKYFSASVKPKEQREDTRKFKVVAGGRYPDEDIPFAPEWRG
jgi:hypothetical protein